MFRDYSPTRLIIMFINNCMDTTQKVNLIMKNQMPVSEQW